MCGLFGWHLKAPLPKAQGKKLLTELIWQNDERGGHSWGAHLHDRRHTIHGLGQMWNSAPRKVLLKSTVLLAHTRFATTGSVTLANAHPFTRAGVTLAHNGVVVNHEALNSRYGRKCDVDSQHILWHLSKGLPLAEVEGWGAITYARDEDVGVRLCSLAGGSLAVAQGSYGVIWSSAREHLEDAIVDAGLVDSTTAIDELPRGVEYETSPLAIAATGQTHAIQYPARKRFFCTPNWKRDDEEDKRLWDINAPLETRAEAPRRLDDATGAWCTECGLDQPEIGEALCTHCLRRWSKDYWKRVDNEERWYHAAE